MPIFPPKKALHLEPFGGSGAVLLSLDPSPGRLDIYNDLNGELSNLFLCVKEKCNALVRELKFLPIGSRAVFELYKDFLAHKDVALRNIQEELEVLEDPRCFTAEQAAELRPILQERQGLYDVQRAAAFYLRIWGSYNATTSSYGTKPLRLYRFLGQLQEASRRLQNVAIENKDAIEIILKRDGPHSRIYCDPPYLGAEKCYEARIDMEYHVRLHQVLSGCAGAAIVSYNDCPEIRRLYDDFYIMAFVRDDSMAKEKGALYGEVLMTNYDPTPFLAEQMSLFSQPQKLRLELVHVPEGGPRHILR